MIILKATTETLELTTSVAGSIDCYASFATVTSTISTPSSSFFGITTATTTTIVTAPWASEQKSVELITIENKGTVSNLCTLKIDNSGTEYFLYSATLQPWENLTYIKGNGFDKHSQAGDDTSINITDKRWPISATSFNLLKVWVACEAVGVLHSNHAATGVPGAYLPGTPGINWRATDGTTVADAGCIPIKNAVTGANYLTAHCSSATTACVPMLIDLMWINTGLVVTTTTAQAMTPVALPARDATGTTNGNDVMFGVLVTTATTNAAAITNMTISYTNQAGTAGKVGTVASFPATAVAGTLVPFQLATGDTGIRSVQSITLGTTLTAGAISLIGYRIISMAPHLVANAGWKFQPALVGSNTRLYNGVCLIPIYMPTATTATTHTMLINVEEK